VYNISAYNNSHDIHTILTRIILAHNNSHDINAYNNSHDIHTILTRIILAYNNSHDNISIQ